MLHKPNPANLSELPVELIFTMNYCICNNSMCYFINGGSKACKTDYYLTLVRYFKRAYLECVPHFNYNGPNFYTFLVFNDTARSLV